MEKLLLLAISWLGLAVCYGVVCPLLQTGVTFRSTFTYVVKLPFYALMLLVPRRY
jgi:hypothetical protein